MPLKVNIQAIFGGAWLAQEGCVGGAGTLSAVNRAAAAVKRYAKTASSELASANKYNDLIPELAGTVSAEVEIAEGS